MRIMERNKQTIGYAVYTGEAEVIENGLRTGVYAATYSTPVLFRASISGAKGESADMIFGSSTDYSRVLITDDMDCAIDVDSQVWVENDITDDNDYVVVEKSKTLNFIAYALKETK